MKIKRFVAWLLAFVMCFTFVSCKDVAETDTVKAQQKTEADSTAEIQEKGPILYRVTDKNGNVIWLFGSIHVGREDFYPLPSYVTDAFESAESLAVEADIVAFEYDYNAQVEALTPLIYLDGSTIEDHIPSELYEEAVEILESYNIYSKEMDYYCPAFWSSMIDSYSLIQLGGDSELGVDLHLIEKANETGKTIEEIESVAIQYKMMADYDDEIQTMLLQSSVEMCNDIDAAAEDLELMMDLWVSGDEEEFSAYMAAEDGNMTAEEKELYERYNQTMVTERNVTMTDYAENALLNGEETFICVGSAHVIGEGAMADLLSERGYKVERITQ